MCLLSRWIPQHSLVNQEVNQWIHIRTNKYSVVQGEIEDLIVLQGGVILNLGWNKCRKNNWETVSHKHINNKNLESNEMKSDYLSKFVFDVLYFIWDSVILFGKMFVHQNLIKIAWIFMIHFLLIFLLWI